MRIRSASILTGHLTASACPALVAPINGIVPKLMSARRANTRAMRTQFALIPSARTRATVKRDIQETEEIVCLYVIRLVSMGASV